MPTILQQKTALRSKLLEVRKNFAFHFTPQLEKNLLIEKKITSIVNSNCLNANSIYNMSVASNIGEDSFFSNSILPGNKKVGLYMAISGEPDLSKLLLQRSWNISLPKVKDEKEIEFIRYSYATRLIKNFKFLSLLEPESGLTVEPQILIIPALAYDLEGYRIGFGKGYYDRYIQEKDILKIGVCFDEFLLEKIPHTKNDLKVNYIVTDKVIIKL